MYGNISFNVIKDQSCFLYTNLLKGHFHLRDCMTLKKYYLKLVVYTVGGG